MIDKDKRKFSKTMISRIIMTKILCRSKLRLRENGFKKVLPALPLLGTVFGEWLAQNPSLRTILLINNHTVFLVSSIWNND